MSKDRVVVAQWKADEYWEMIDLVREHCPELLGGIEFEEEEARFDG